MRRKLKEKKVQEKKEEIIFPFKNYDLYKNSNIGLRRKLNEDVAFYLKGKDFILLCVADGMGGSPKGDVASELAEDAIAATFNEVRDEGVGSDANAEKVLRKAVRRANSSIHRLSSASDEYYGMGTTLVMALILLDKTFIVNCGDSRAYSFHKKDLKLQQETTDQTIIEYLYKLKAISEEEKEKSPHRHVLMNALGVSPSVTYQFLTLKNDYDAILLCSDGLTNMVSANDIARILEETEDESARSAGSALITAALLAGGLDNVSVCLAEVRKNESR